MIGEMIASCCNRLPKVARFSVTIFTYQSVNTIPSQGIYRGIEAASTCSVTLTLSVHLTDCFVCPFPNSIPLTKKQATCGKNPRNKTPLNNEHLRSKSREFKTCMEERCVRPSVPT
jgi:hypothetical protein